MSGLTGITGPLGAVNEAMELIIGSGQGGMEENMERGWSVRAHSTASLAFFLGFAFLPRILPNLNGQRLFFWLSVVGSVLAFVMTNVAYTRAMRRGSGGS